VNYTEKCSL